VPAPDPTSFLSCPWRPSVRRTPLVREGTSGCTPGARGSQGMRKVSVYTEAQDATPTVIPVHT